MDDQVLMRVGHSRAHLAEKLDSLGRLKVVAVAKGPQWFALYILHHEEGQAIVARPAIEQPRDIRMVELGQNLALIAEPAQNVLRIEATPDQFERDLLSVFIVGARREIDGAQSTPANFTDDLVSAKTPTGESVLGPFGKEIRRNLQSQLPVGSKRPRLRIGREQGLHFLAKGRVALALPFEHSRTFVRRQIDHGLEHSLNPR